MHVSRLLTRTLEQLRTSLERGQLTADPGVRRAAPVPRASMERGCSSPSSTSGREEEPDTIGRGVAVLEVPGQAQQDQLGEQHRPARPGADACAGRQAQSSSAAAVGQEEQRRGHAHRQPVSCPGGPARSMPKERPAAPRRASAPRRPPAGPARRGGSTASVRSESGSGACPDGSDGALSRTRPYSSCVCDQADDREGLSSRRSCNDQMPCAAEYPPRAPRTTPASHPRCRTTS